MTAAAAPSPSPLAFDVTFLRDLDATSRDAIVAAGSERALSPGDPIYCQGDASESFFVVMAGTVALTATRRGDTEASLLRTARQGDSFGEEATLPGVSRRSTAAAAEPARVFEIPIAVFRRAVERSGGHAAERERRYLQRSAVTDLIASSALGRRLGARDVDALVDACRLEPFARGERVFSAGDLAGDLFLVVDGLIQLQSEHDGRPAVAGYLSHGDLFGDEEALAGGRREVSAAAIGDSWCAVIPAAAARSVGDRHPGLFASLRRIAGARAAAIAADSVGASSTQHVFRDLYRLQVARSLLVIDQDSCVRCGHCAWSCAEVHGQTRLVRRGDKVVAHLTASAHQGPSSLLLPSSCQHCRHAACMIDCPTGAIGRDLGGEVFIREELCTGCGNCAKACPWQNIQIAPRAAAASLTLSREVAVKCDLCRDYTAPACVQACPTESILRIDPGRDIAEVSLVVGPRASGLGPRVSAGGAVVPGPEARAPRPEARGPLPWLAAAGAVALAVAGLAIAKHAAGLWRPGAGASLVFGAIATLLMLALAGYSVPKRVVSMWMTRRQKGLRAEAAPAPRSRTRAHLIAHLCLGALSASAALAHTGPRLGGGVPGALAIAFWLAAALGAAGALAYWIVPSRLSRLERRGALPEDLAAERRAAGDRLYRDLSGRSDLVKTIADRIVLPYARATLGSLSLVVSGRSLTDERARLRASIDSILAGRGGDRLDGLDDLVRTAVDQRALGARRALSAALRGWLPVHIAASAVALALLAAHIAIEVLR